MINYLAIFVCGVLSIVGATVWYGMIFKKKWMEIVGAGVREKEARAKMEKSSGSLYVLQFLLSLFQIYVLAYLIACWPKTNGVELAVFLWAGFVVPLVASGAMWNNDSAKVSWARFLIQASFELIMFVIYGYILTVWH